MSFETYKQRGDKKSSLGRTLFDVAILLIIALPVALTEDDGVEGEDRSNEASVLRI